MDDIDVPKIMVASSTMEGTTWPTIETNGTSEENNNDINVIISGVNESEDILLNTETPVTYINELDPPSSHHASTDALQVDDQSSLTPTSNTSRASSPRIKRKIEAKKEPKREERTRKYSLPFLKRDKKEPNKDAVPPSPISRGRSISAFELKQPISELNMDYDLNVMRKKSCIALRNPYCPDDADFNERVRECTNLVKAIEIAAYEINEKEKKKTKRKKSRHQLEDNCDNCDNLKETLDQCKESELMISTVNRLDARRSGISERCEAERQLVKQSVKYLIQNQFMTMYNG